MVYDQYISQNKLQELHEICFLIPINEGNWRDIFFFLKEMNIECDDQRVTVVLGVCFSCDKPFMQSLALPTGCWGLYIYVWLNFWNTHLHI